MYRAEAEAFRAATSISGRLFLGVVPSPAPLSCKGSGRRFRWEPIRVRTVGAFGTSGGSARRFRGGLTRVRTVGAFRTIGAPVRVRIVGKRQEFAGRVSELY